MLLDGSGVVIVNPVSDWLLGVLGRTAAVPSYTGRAVQCSACIINIIAIDKTGSLQLLHLVYLNFKPIIEMKFVRFIMKNAALANAPHHIEHFSKFSPSPLSMKQFLDFGESFFCCVICSCLKSFASLD